MFRRNKVSVLFTIMLLTLTASLPVFSQESEEHCVVQMTPGGGSIFGECFSTPQEADQAIQEYNVDGISSRSVYVIALLYDWTNYQNSSLTLTSTISTGCQSTGYGADFTSTWNDRLESGIGYLDCNYILIYENAGASGSLNPCASPCSSFGLLNNQGSAFKLQRNYP